MARSLWTGSLSFGLVNVPVRCTAPSRDLDLHFRQLHEKDGAPIETRRVLLRGGQGGAVRGGRPRLRADDGEQVVLTDDDLAAAEPRKTRTIDIEAFVDLEDVDPIYFDHPYFLAPGRRGRGRPARLPPAREGHGEHRPRGARALRAAQQGVPRARARPRRRADAHDAALPRRGAPDEGHRHRRAASRAKAQLDAAVEADRGARRRLGPRAYEDCYRERLLEVIERKRKGRKITAPESSRDAGGPPPDIMDGAEGVARAGAGGGGLRPGGDDGTATAAASTDLSRDELYERAQKEDVAGRSSMSRKELIEALSELRAGARPRAGPSARSARGRGSPRAGRARRYGARKPNREGSDPMAKIRIQPHVRLQEWVAEDEGLLPRRGPRLRVRPRGVRRRRRCTPTRRPCQPGDAAPLDGAQRRVRGHGEGPHLRRVRRLPLGGQRTPRPRATARCGARRTRSASRGSSSRPTRRTSGPRTSRA